MENHNISGKKLHVLLFPLLAHGHIAAYAEVSKRLVEKGVNVYFLSTPRNVAKIIKDGLLAQENSSSPGKGKIQLLQLPLPTVEGLPPGAESTADIPMHTIPFLNKAMDGLEVPFEQLLREIRPDCVVFDFVQWWAGKVAANLRIPSVSFTTFGATFSSYALNPVWRQYGDRGLTAEDLICPPPDYPSPRVSWKLHEAQNESFSYRAVKPDTVSGYERCLRSFDVCSAIAVKACHEIEGRFIEYLQTVTGKPLLLLGPLLPDYSPARECAESYFMKWLDQQAPRTVVYVSFGSQFFLSKKEIEEVAAGLEASGHPFLWALNVNCSEKGRLRDWLPPGFEERIGNGGVVVPEWVPQREVLSHPSTGSFLTHCGWNSVMEAMSVGLPLIVSPMRFDQCHNARLVVEELKAGVEIGRGKDGSFKREEVCKAIRIVMGKDKQGKDLGKRVRSNASEIGDVFQRNILKGGGSQDMYLMQFIEHLCLLKADGKSKENGRAEVK